MAPYYAIPKIGVRAVLPGSIGVRIVDCSALDGLGESSQKLLDERGCPVDEQVCAIKQNQRFYLNLIFTIRLYWSPRLCIHRKESVDCTNALISTYLVSRH